MSAQLFIASIVTLGAGMLLARPVISWLQQRDHFDLPTGRSSHSIPVPRGGGLIVVGAVAVGAATEAVYSAVLGRRELTAIFWLMMAMPGLMFALGLAEDFKGLRIRTRLMGQATIAFVSVVSLVVMSARSPIWVLPMVLSAIAYVNIANFMDGVNGISGIHGIVAGATYAAVGREVGAHGVPVAAALLAAASAAFLPWNAPTARLFLGDCGSYLLGAFVVTLGIVVALHGAAPELAVAPMCVYVADTGWTLAWRYRQRQPLSQAHRSHVYQRLTDLGLTHMTSAVIVGATTVLVVIVSAAAAALPPLRAVLDGCAAALLAAYLALPRGLREIRESQPRQKIGSHGQAR